MTVTRHPNLHAIYFIFLLLGIFGDLIPTGQNLQRWYKFLSQQDAIKYALSKLHLQPVGSQSGEVSESSLQDN